MTCIEKEFIDVNSVLSRAGNIKLERKKGGMKKNESE